MFAQMKEKEEIRKARLEEGKERQRIIEAERLAKEKEEQKAHLQQRRAFHEMQRRKAAERALWRERHAREAQEREAGVLSLEAKRVDALVKVKAEQAGVLKRELDELRSKGRSASAPRLRVTNKAAPTSKGKP